MPILKNNRGFTLLELIVVMAIISIMLFISLPRFGNMFSEGDSTKKFSRWIISQVRLLKNFAVRDQKLYILNVDIDANRIWTTTESGESEGSPPSVFPSYQFSEGIHIIDIEYPGKGKISLGQTEILFNKKGYSDKALIHIENDNGEQLSYLIEPFLKSVKIYQHYAGFED
jgi:prepilin-type N-terminal cleavage/methylation domain-containing protein